MKKILLIVCILLLSGCYENSGYITKSCFKEETSNGLFDKKVYTFTFKEDVINKLTILYDYSDNDKNIISSIKSSLDTQNRYVNVDYKVLVDSDNQYKIQYDIDMNNNEYWDKFKVVSSRTELVKNLRALGYT